MIESINNERVKYWTKLSDKKYQNIEDKFIVEGAHLVEEAYKSGNLIETIALICTESPYENTTYVSEAVMKKITNLATPPKIIGVVKKLKSREVRGNTLLLDEIRDPGNLGTIIRSAVAFNIDTIILGLNTVSIYNPKVVRATEGLIFHINIIEASLENFIPKLKEDGYKVYTSDVESGTPLKDIEFNDKSAIIIGNEGSGVNKTISGLADEYIYIETSDNCESLNAAVAASIILYELNR